MADELQALLDRIHDEGVKKADDERDRILADAREEAARIVEDAKTQASQTTTQAQQEAAMLLEKGKESLRQAGRDTLLSLREQLQERMSAVAAACAGEGLTADAMGEIIVALAKSFLDSGGDAARVEVLLSDKQKGDLQNALLAKLGDSLRAQPELKPMPNIDGGFVLRVAGSDIVYDFSDEALAETLCAFLNPKLAELIAG